MLANTTAMKKVLFALFVTPLLIASCGEEKKKTPVEYTPAKQEEAKPEAKKIETPDEIMALLEKHTCLTCHKADEKLVGPAYKEVAKRQYPDEKIVHLIYNPEPKNWPDYPPMLALKNVPEEDALKIAKWINSLDD